MAAFLLLVALPVLLSFVLFLPAVQTRLVAYVTKRLSSDLNTEISIGRVHVLPYSGIRLRDFLVRDLQNDTLFFAPRVSAGIDHFSISKKHLYLGAVAFERPSFRISQQEEGMNFSFLIDLLGREKRDTVPWHYSVRRARINRGSLRFTHSILKNPSLRHDTLLFNNLTLNAVRTSNVNDSLAFRLDEFSLTEQSGLTVNSAGGRGRFYPDRISVEDFFLETSESAFNIDLLELSAKPPGQDSVMAQQRFRAVVSKIVVSPSEAALFFNNIPPYGASFGLSGEVYGTLDNLKGRDVILSLGEKTWLSASFDVNDLSDFKQTFVYIDVKNLQTTIPDLENILGLGRDGKEPLPPSFRQLGIINYSGNLTGFFNDMVAYGDFNTGLGVIRTDLGFKLNEKGELIYSGFLSTRGFDLGKMVNASKSLGKVTMDMEVKGNRKSNVNYFAFLDGNINSLVWNDYDYKNVSLKGLITHQRFDGAVDFIDPNISFSFDGEIDMSAAVPRFHFLAHIENAQLDRMNLIPTMKEGVLTATLAANFEGDNLDDLIGDIGIYEGLLYTPTSSVEIDSLTIKAVREGEFKRITLDSDFMEGELSGRYYFRNFRKTLLDKLHHFMPAVAPVMENPHPELYNDFKFELSFLGLDKLLSVVYPGLEVSGDGKVKGQFDGVRNVIDVQAGFEHVKLNSMQAEDLEFYMDGSRNKPLSVTTRAHKLMMGNVVTLFNFSVHQKAQHDTLNMNVFWNNWDAVTHSGALYTTTSLSEEKNKGYYASVKLLPSTIILGDSIWNIDEARALITSDAYSIQGFRMQHHNQRLSLNGFLHRQAEDGLKLDMENIDLSQFFGPHSTSAHAFSGIADGSLELQDYFRTPMLSANLTVDDIGFDGDTLGLFAVSSRWDPQQQAMELKTSIKRGETESLLGQGKIYSENNSIDIGFEVDSLQISFLDTFLKNILQDIEGTASGRLFLSGPLRRPILTGKLKVNQGRFNVDLLKTSYQLKDSVWFYANEIRFKNIKIIDRYGHRGSFKGSIYHNGFSDMVYNMRMDVDNMLVLNTRQKDNPLYYGTVYGTGFMTVTGSTQNINLNISGTTHGNTRFFIPMENTEEALQSNFIRFVSPTGSADQQGEQDQKRNYSVDLSGVELNMEIDVTPEAQVQIIFDSTIGDILRASGEGSIQIRIDRQGNVRFYGGYTIEEGEYLFSLQNLVNKRFVINKGGTVTWRGAPYDAELDLTAVYKLKASLSDLWGGLGSSGIGQNDNDMQRRIPIHTNLMLTGPLQEPGIRFGIEAPTLSESRESYMLDFISTEDELNRQVLSLLLLNRFYTPEYMRMDNSSGTSTNRAALVTTTEMLSNQLSRWLSTISSDLDVGVSYRPEDHLSSEEIEVALSTQMFNNRVTINGNVGYGKYETNTGKMVGDFDMDVKLNPSGTIRAKAYTRSNDDLIYETSPTTQGIGLSFKEEFNNFKELLQKYWSFFTGKKKENL